MTVNELKHQANLKKWKENILDCRASGQTVTAWCAQYGCDKSTYYRWERELFGRTTTASDEHALKPLGMTPPVASLAQPELAELPIAASLSAMSERTANDFRPTAVVHIGKYELKLSNSVSPELMRQLKGLVEGAE